MIIIDPPHIHPPPSHSLRQAFSLSVCLFSPKQVPPWSLPPSPHAATTSTTTTIVFSIQSRTEREREKERGTSRKNRKTRLRIRPPALVVHSTVCCLSKRPRLHNEDDDNCGSVNNGISGGGVVMIVAREGDVGCS